MCSETSPPRFSFSHDLSDSELKILPMKPKNVPCNDTLILDTKNYDFEFNTSNIFEFEPSSADELFYNGVILPIHHTLQEKTNISTTKHNIPYVKPSYTKLPPIPSSPSSVDMKKESIRELLNGNNKKPHSKSFWGFSRSKSLNCDVKKNLSSTCSNLHPFSRSKSTGSVSNPKKMSSNKQQYSSAAAKSTSSSLSYSSYSCCSSMNFYPNVVQKSPSGKSYGGSYYGNNGLRVSPVLNVPTPCVSKGSANFFGLGSFFSVGKVKKNKK